MAVWHSTKPPDVAVSAVRMCAAIWGHHHLQSTVPLSYLVFRLVQVHAGGRCGTLFM